MKHAYKRYIIRRHHAIPCLDSIGWNVKISNSQVAKNLFHKDCKTDAYLAVFVDGKPSSFEPYYEDRPAMYYDVELLECPVTSTTYKIGEIK